MSIALHTILLIASTIMTSVSLAYLLERARTLFIWSMFALGLVASILILDTLVSLLKEVV